MALGEYWKSHNHHSCTLKADRKYLGAWSVPSEFVNLESVLPDETIHLLKCDIEGAELDFVTSTQNLLSAF